MPSDDTCSRCGQETDHTTLTGKRLCPDCQAHRSGEETTRDLDQQSLDDVDGGEDRAE